MLPPPTLTFTIPSVYDDLVLHCRVYHPTDLAPTTVSGITEWRKKAAIVAHPYAPLGGCYDDPVVDLVASTILKLGFVVGTFNFRGAGNSKGRTSWQSKPEQNDYISFIGFMIYYLYHLCPPPVPLLLRHPDYTQSDPSLHDLSPIPSQAVPVSHQDHISQYLSPTSRTSTSALEETKQNSNSKTRLLLAGYSYGALITCSLPPIISSIISPFQAPAPNSPQAEIRLRACSLASQQNNLMAVRVHSLLSQANPRGRTLQIEDNKLSSPKTRKANGGVRMGGEENLRRASHESYRSKSSFSLDSPVMVKSMDRIRSMGKAGKDSPRRHGSTASSFRKKASESESSIEQHPAPDDKESIKAIPGIGDNLHVAYLLVSPLQGWVNSLATMWSSKSAREKDSVPEHEMKFTIDPTLALFGDDDVFVSVKKLRSWTEKLSNTRKSKERCQFRHKEIAGAGHFWNGYEAVQTLQREIKDFVSTL